MVCLLCYSILFMYMVFIIVKYLVPLKIRDRYIIAFYSMLTIMLSSAIMEVVARLADNDPAFMLNRN